MEQLKTKLQHKIDQKTKPLGALGQLEHLALQIGTIQNTLNPSLNNPYMIVFAGDHGIAEEGVVNPFPQEVTWQMVYNFLAGGAAINIFAQQNKMSLKVVDAGVKHDFDEHPDLIQAKVAYGTKNYLHEPAMSREQCEQAMAKGKEIIQKIHQEGSNVVGFGEMGIGNTSSAALMMSTILQVDIHACVGSGTGLHGEQLNKKKEVLAEVVKRRNVNQNDPLDILSQLGGFEIAMMCGAILEASKLNMIILIDGFIVTSALLIAQKIDSSVKEDCIFTHSSHEQGHVKMLDYLQAKPILALDLRLGEGTGAALAYPIVEASVNFLNQMASFESAGVENTDQ